MKKILLIEDDQTVRENTAELLDLGGYEVITASNGKIGIDKAIKNIPDIIICDIMMPELNGYGVLQILSKNSALNGIPFIFLSAKTDAMDIRKGMNLGADDYLTKPYDESELFSAIESRLEKFENKNKIENEVLSPTERCCDDGLKTLKDLQNYFNKKAEKVIFAENEIIYYEGNKSNHIFLIESGVVKTHKTDEKGKELITALYRENDFFGFSSFSKDIPYQEIATAIEDTKAYKLTKSELKEVIKNNFSLSLKLIDYVTNNLIEINEHLLEMAYSSVRQKTAHSILEFSKKEKYQTKKSINISRSDLASIAGIATETFIRTISDFKKEGIIDVQGRNIKILDMDKLKKLR